MIAPRTTGSPRPVSSPVSESPSEYAMLIPARDRGRGAGDERDVRLVRVDRDCEDRGDRGERAVDEARQGGLDALQEELLVRGHE